MALKLDPQIPDADALYQCLVDLDRGLSADETEAARSALILLLANQIEDLETVREAVNLARETAEARSAAAPS